MKTFDLLSLKEPLLRNLAELGFDSMTPIQEKAIPFVLDGKDLIAKAKTGSGKTAAFGLGILQFLDTELMSVQSLILCPTRELAEQVALEVRKLARLMNNIKVLTLCGGAQAIHQEKSLEYGAHIIVGTPGRVLDFLNRKVLVTKSIGVFVLDEADKMLDMGFKEDILEIAKHLPKKRQTLLFSATYPEQIKAMSIEIQRSALEVHVDTEHEEDIIIQKFYELQRHRDKPEALLKILGIYKPERFIIFCQTKQTTDDIADFLNDHGIISESLHGDLLQNERTSTLVKFTNKSLTGLVATDVAARGIDIQGLPAVINYDLPSDPQIYTHRIGRTGRAGESGLAFNLFVERNRFKLEKIEEALGKTFEVDNLSEMVKEEYGLTPPMSTLYISGGKKDKLRPGDILGAIVGETKLPANVVGDIHILAVISYVAVQREHADIIIDKLKLGKIKNRKFKVGLA